jgi:hypothetical protein
VSARAPGTGRNRVAFPTTWTTEPNHVYPNVSLHHPRRGVAALLVAMVTTMLPAHAMGAVSGSATGDAGRINAECGYTADLPGTSARRTEVAITATARATATDPTNPVVSTRVLCTLESEAGVDAIGATRVGPLSVAEGIGGYNPQTANQGVSLCFEASAQYDDGSEVDFARRCVDYFDTSILNVKADGPATDDHAVVDRLSVAERPSQEARPMQARKTILSLPVLIASLASPAGATELLSPSPASDRCCGTAASGAMAGSRVKAIGLQTHDVRTTVEVCVSASAQTTAGPRSTAMYCQPR